MTRFSLLATLLAAVGFTFTDPSLAQESGGPGPSGGICGLRDTVPPRPPAKKPKPAGPVFGGPARGAAPGAASPTGLPAPASAPAVAVDPTLWSQWWAFNREPYYDLRQQFLPGQVHRGGDDFFLGRGQAAVAKDSVRPTDAMIRGVVVPELLRVLETERNNDLIVGSLFALAKIGDRGPTRSLRGVFVPFLRSGEQRICETATLALGILGDDDAAPILASLMTDDARGRRLVGGKAVPIRTRTFAAYGLGLVGHRTASNELRRDIARHLIEVLELGRLPQPDLQVGAVLALGIVPLDWASPPAGRTGVAAIVSDRTSLLRYLVKRMDADTRGDRGFAADEVRAHVPTAAAGLVAAPGVGSSAVSDAVRGEVVDGLLAIVRVHSRESNVQVTQSATIALGVIGNAATGPGPIGEQNVRIFEELRRIARSSAYGQTEFFALVALAQIGCRGGPGATPFGLQMHVQKELLTALARGKGQKKPWAAIALGVFGSAVRQNTGALDATLIAAVREAARGGDRPDEAGAYAIALGLLQDLESEELLLERLAYFRQDDTRGHIAVGLGLMGAKGSTDRIVGLMAESQTRPELIEQAAIAVGLLGDRSAVRGLIAMLRGARGFSAQAAIAAALGRIGDAQSVPPLVQMLGDERITDAARSFAAVALGIVCDKDDLPWNAKLAVNVNYRANVSTLTNQLGSGVLDVL